MKRVTTITLALAAALLVSGCSQEDMDYFLASGQGDWSVMNTNRSYATTVQPRRCYQSSRRHVTCFD